MNHKHAASIRIGLVLLMLAGSTATWADKIITRSGQTLEGVIKDENAFNVRLDNRGNIISVPRERIKSIARISLDENVRMLLEHATDALGRADVAGARTYVEQARTLNTASQAILNEIEKLSKQIMEMEIRGGTPEERRMRSEALLQRAKEAFDLIRTEEGNNLLLRALQTDPTYDKAHEEINKLLAKGNPDMLLAALYFTQVMWPDNVKMESPVVKLLPRIYAALAQLFAESSDPERSKTYAQLMKKLSEAFTAHPTWKETSDEKAKAVIGMPVDGLLGQIVKESIDKKNYELGMKKLEGLVAPDSSVEAAMLYLRGLIGAERYSDAITLLDKLMTKFPEEASLKLQYSALKLLVQGIDVEKTNKATATTFYEQIYATRANVVPEIGDAVGRLLGQLKGPEMDVAAGAGQLAHAADVASIVMLYGQDPAMRRHAAQVMIQTLQKLPWKLDLVWKINGTPVPLSKAAMTFGESALKPQLMVNFDPASPFVVRMTIDAQTTSPAAQVVQALSNNQPLASPVLVSAFNFSLEAAHPTMGTIYKSVWKSSDVPQAEHLFVPPPPPPDPKAAAAKATPAPGAAPAAEGAPAAAPAAPEGAPAAAAAPAPTPDAAAAKPKAKKQKGGGVMKIETMNTIELFMMSMNDEGLIGYVKGWPKVTLLPSHLSVPMAQDILKEE